MSKISWCHDPQACSKRRTGWFVKNFVLPHLLAEIAHLIAQMLPSHPRLLVQDVFKTIQDVFGQGDMEVAVWHHVKLYFVKEVYTL